jgi:hypothetical protein
MPFRIALAAISSFLICVALFPSATCADFVTLRNGGEVRGEFVGEGGSKSRGETVSIRTLSGATVVVGRNEIDAIVRRRLVAEEYETRRRAVPDTAEAHWDLAEWCRQRSLPKEREGELRRIVELDPEHVAAHRALGHIRHKGKWGTQDEVMTARGFVKHKGKYVLPQELELIQQEERVTEAERGWFRKVKMWHTWLEGGYPERQSEALAQLQAIKEPDAVAALARTFKAVPVEEQRLLYVRIIAKIDGDRPLQPLVLQSLWDESRFVREAAIRGVRNRDVDKALPAYVRALKNGLNIIVNRAGAALGELGNDSVVPALIDALVTRHSYTVLVPDPPVNVASDGTDMATGQPVLPPGVGRMLAAGMLPYGVQVQNLSSTGPRMREVPIEKDEENQDVLEALNLLTGENFGFDEEAWRKWYNAQHNLKRSPATGAARKQKSRSQSQSLSQ